MKQIYLFVSYYIHHQLIFFVNRIKAVIVCLLYALSKMKKLFVLFCRCKKRDAAADYYVLVIISKYVFTC